MFAMAHGLYDRHGGQAPLERGQEHKRWGVLKAPS